MPVYVSPSLSVSHCARDRYSLHRDTSERLTPNQHGQRREDALSHDWHLRFWLVNLSQPRRRKGMAADENSSECSHSSVNAFHLTI